MLLPANQARSFHSLEQRGYRIRITAHQAGQFALLDPFVLKQRPHHGELVGSDPKMRDAAAKCLFNPYHARRSNSGNRRLSGASIGTSGTPPIPLSCINQE